MLIECLLLTLAAPPTPAALAARIDARLEARWKAEKVVPAPPASDAEFLRRASLDLTGRIPRPADVHAFLARKGAKDAALIDELLDDPRYAVHFANLWRAELAPEIETEPQARLLQAGLEAWLRGKARKGHDELARELLTVALPAGDDGEPVLRDPTRANPLAFYAVKRAVPENLAAAVARSFLGVRLECAQCHDHPFARWKQDEFWALAASFAGVEPRGRGVFAPIREVKREAIAPAAGAKPIPVRFLGTGGGKPGRAALAAWMTAKGNPFFARAAANRAWARLFGVGLVEPVDDFRDDNAPKDPILLDELAAAFAESGYDMRYLLRSLALTRAYRRTSARTDASQDRAAVPARMTVKALSGEQFFDSLILATGYRDEDDGGAARRLFLSRFAHNGTASEPETSVQQALTLLNGRFVARYTDPDRGPVLLAVAKTPGMTLEERIEALHVATLSRKPTEREIDRLREYVARGGPEARRLADVFWMLLNRAEFRVNP